MCLSGPLDRADPGVEVEGFLDPEIRLAVADQIGRTVASALTAKIPDIQLRLDGARRLTAASIRISAADRA